VRADADRNAAAILDAAREVVTERGIDAPMSEIARRAGLAVGTLYRHHPTKHHLVAAVVADSAERMASAAAGALTRVERGELGAVDALVELVRDAAEIYAAERAFKERLGTYDPHDPFAGLTPGSAEARALAGVADLLGRAQREGGVRADLTVADLAVLLAGMPAVAGRPREIYLEVVLAGLAPVRPADRMA
jgi:AcrR family transcriptional regulator